MRPDNTAFAKRLRALLDEKGMRQKDLAAAAGVHEVLISRYCTGERIPKYSTLCKIASALGITVDDMMGEKRVNEAAKPESVVRVGPYEYGRCPECHSVLDTLGNPNYCGHCGLAVKWSD